MVTENDELRRIRTWHPDSLRQAFHAAGTLDERNAVTELILEKRKATAHRTCQGPGLRGADQGSIDFRDGSVYLPVSLGGCLSTTEDSTCKTDELATGRFGLMGCGPNTGKNEQVTPATTRSTMSYYTMPYPPTRSSP